MNKEEFLIKLCSAYLRGEKLSPKSDINLAELYNFAKVHNLSAICHVALDLENSKSEACEQVKTKFLNSFLDAVYLHQLQMNTLDELKGIMSDADLFFICFKGAALKSLYPVPESRLMGDIDVLIKEDSRDKIKKLLCKNGFSCTAENGPVYNYVKNGVLIEVHTRLNGEYTMGVFEKPFDYAQFDGYEGSFDDSFHLACLVAHTAHHFRFYGAGVRMLLDIAVMLDKSSADIDTALKYLESCNLEKFSRVIFSLCFKWFGKGKDFGENTERTEEFLLSGGAFGSENKNKGAVLARRELEQGKNVSPLLSKLRLAFPAYSRLKEIDYIKFINGRPWLVPYAWGYRFFYNIKHRRQFMADAVESLGKDETKRQAEKQLDYFEEIGLYGK